MNTKDYNKLSTEDLVLDNDFLKLVLHPDQDHTWEDFLKKYPEKKESIQEAILIIRTFQIDESLIPSDRLNLIKQKIKINPPSSHRISSMLIKIAAGLILLITIGGLSYNYLFRQPEMPFELADEKLKEKGKLILADGSVREFESEITTIKQTPEGKLTLNNDTIVEDLSKLKSDKVVMNQLIIPYGIRSELTLADGTHIWLNSGSQLSYPVTFIGNQREVFLSGEAYFDVSTDKTKPFTVITGEVKVKVLGTKFNISSYENDPTTQVVLLEGKITSGRNKAFAKPVELSPGERLIYDKSIQNLSKDKVDVELYSSWINGYLIFRNEPVSGIFRKLERYYNRQIVVEQNMDDITFSGKLDLIENLDMVLENISFSASFEVTKENNIYTIKI